MKKKISILIGGLLIALLVVGGIGTSVAYAQAPTNTPFHGRGGPGRHGMSEAVLEAAADALNMTTDEVKSSLQSGKTLEDLAEEAGVDIEDVRAAIQAVRETEIRERIAQELEDGTITQAQADWLLEGLEQGFLGRPGGFGGHGPKGGGEGQPPFGPPNQNSGG